MFYEFQYVMDTYIIREIELEDYYKGCLELYGQDFQINVHEISKKDFDEYLIRKRKNGYKIFVCEYKLKIVGLATCFIEEKLIHNFGKVAHVEDVIVDKNIRNCGLGKKMINHCINYSKKEKAYKIILDCSEKNLKFYEKCGFEKKGCFMALYFD